MRYFEHFKHLRQALCVLTVLLLVGATNFGQEKVDSTAAKDQKQTKTEQAETKTETSNQKFQPSKIEAKSDLRFFGNESKDTEKLASETERPSFQSVAINGSLTKNSNANSELPKAPISSESFLNGKPKSFNKFSSEINADADSVIKPSQTDDSKSLKIGGHAGFVVPIYGYGNGSYSRFYDDFTFGFPVGLTLKPKGPVAIDFEFIFLSAASPNNRRFVFVIHPGVIYGFKKKYAVGVRAAYEANNNDAYGFTPLVSRSFKINDKLNHFIEFDFPVRWNKRTVRVGNRNFNDRFLSGAWAIHYGVSF